MPDPPASSYLALRGRSASASMRLSDAKNREERYKELVEEVLTTLKNRGEHAKFAMLDVRDIVCTSADVTYAQAVLATLLLHSHCYFGYFSLGLSAAERTRTRPDSTS